MRPSKYKRTQFKADFTLTLLYFTTPTSSVFLPLDLPAAILSLFPGAPKAERGSQSTRAGEGGD